MNVADVNRDVNNKLNELSQVLSALEMNSPDPINKKMIQQAEKRLTRLMENPSLEELESLSLQTRRLFNLVPENAAGTILGEVTQAVCIALVDEANEIISIVRGHLTPSNTPASTPSTTPIPTPPNTPVSTAPSTPIPTPPSTPIPKEKTANTPLEKMERDFQKLLGESSDPLSSVVGFWRQLLKGATISSWQAHKGHEYTLTLKEIAPIHLKPLMVGKESVPLPLSVEMDKETKMAVTTQLDENNEKVCLITITEGGPIVRLDVGKAKEFVTKMCDFLKNPKVSEKEKNAVLDELNKRLELTDEEKLTVETFLDNSKLAQTGLSILKGGLMLKWTSTLQAGLKEISFDSTEVHVKGTSNFPADPGSTYSFLSTSALRILGNFLA